MNNDTFTGPPRQGERYADEIEWEGHMNTPWTIPGARYHESPGRDEGTTNFDLVIPHVSRMSRFEGDETVVALADGCTIRSGCSNEAGGFISGEYVRLCGPDGEDIAYWDNAEWREDPILVMGAFLNAAAGARLTLS